MTNNKEIIFSVVVPVFNESENIANLHKEIKIVMKGLKSEFEIIFVDDGSSDNTFKVLEKLSPVKIIKLRKNFGQSAALDAGIKASIGKYIITLDGDGQNDPNDIKKLIKKLNEGYDVVCGWRHKRKDNFSKKFISRGARFLRKFFVDDGIHDSGCTLRIYKRECFDDLDLHGEMHRMIAALLKWRGFRIAEIEAHHRARKFGKTKYNWKRTIKGFLDMIYIWFWRKYSSRPMHLFGSLGLFLVFMGCLILSILAVMWLFCNYSLSNKIWPLVGFFMVMIGVQFLINGIISANMVDSEKIKKYYISSVIEK